MVTQEFQINKQSNKIIEEAFSFLKVNFNFCNFHKQYKSLTVLSSNPKEGKTTIAINLSMNFANAGVKTLLVDTDFRKHIRGKNLSLDVKDGLANYLTEDIKLEDVIVSSNIDNLHYLPCGTSENIPSTLLSSKGFEEFLKEIRFKYEIIIFDTPSISSAVDGYIMASKSDATLLVIKAGEVGLPTLKRIKEQLEKAKINVIGVVMNRVEQSEYRKIFGAYDYYIKKIKFTRNVRKTHN